MLAGSLAEKYCDFLSPVLAGSLDCNALTALVAASLSERTVPF